MAADLVCERCGRGFVGYRSDARFCSECRREREREHGNRARPERATGRQVECVCVNCGDKFTAKRSDAARCQPCADYRRRSLLAATERIRPKGRCIDCGAEISREAKRCPRCRGLANRGANNASYRNGTTYHKAGYRFVLDQRPNAKRPYVAEHRLIWEQAHGPIPAGHIVHHLNGDKTDNRIENLVVLTNSAHRKMHSDVDGERSHYIQALEARIRELEQTPRD